MNNLMRIITKYAPNGLEIIGGAASIASSALSHLNVSDIYNIGFGLYFMSSGLKYPPYLPKINNKPFYEAIKSGINETISAKSIVIAGSLGVGIYLQVQNIPANDSFLFAGGVALTLAGTFIRKKRLNNLEEKINLQAPGES